MSVTVENLKAHLNITTDDDDALLTDKIAVAQAWIEAFIGVAFDDAEIFPDGVPEPLNEAVRQLASHFYENREATLVGVSIETLPFGVIDLASPYREWIF